jgi:hypothetical protein
MIACDDDRIVLPGMNQSGELLLIVREISGNVPDVLLAGSIPKVQLLRFDPSLAQRLAPQPVQRFDAAARNIVR